MITNLKCFLDVTGTFSALSFNWKFLNFRYWAILRRKLVEYDMELLQNMSVQSSNIKRDESAVSFVAIESTLLNFILTLQP